MLVSSLSLLLSRHLIKRKAFVLSFDLVNIAASIYIYELLNDV